MTTFTSLKKSGALFFITMLPGFAIATTNANDKTPPLCRCQPQDACWPNEHEWSTLEKNLTGHLVKPTSSIAPCQTDAKSEACIAALKNIHNPFFLESNPGDALSQGYLGGWMFKNSVYAVEAENTADVVAAVNFAREHSLRLAIKGTGHDYLGRSNAPNSLLIWTHNMRKITFNDSFVPASCAKNEKGTPVITVGAGTRWLEAYNEVTNKHGRYVQGGGCTTVGAAGGFIQGGGYGSYSKKYGVAAAGIIEAEIVTAEGKVLIANQCQNQDLFWAVRGGGGGTFGVVTKLSLKTHELPKYAGIYQGKITAKNDVAYKALLDKILPFYRQYLNNEHWGEQLAFRPDNTLGILLFYQGDKKNGVNETWLPMQQWIKQHSDAYTMDSTLWPIPPKDLWNYDFWMKNHPEFIITNTLKNAAPKEFWYALNGHELYAYWYTYQSWRLPQKLFNDDNIQNLADIIFKSSRVAPIEFHINKGLAGASPEAIHRSKETSVSPAVFDTAGLVIIGAANNTIYDGVKGHEPDLKKAELATQKVNTAMKFFIDAAPNAGAYANEADYFQKNWQQAFWGANYAKLLSIKQKYDPTGLFYCHHCVGSEQWEDNGMCRVKP